MRQERNLARRGRFGDTMVAHISPREAAILKALGGSGTRNPRTGLREFWTSDDISNWYQQYLGRPADQGGLNYWTGEGATAYPDDRAMWNAFSASAGMAGETTTNWSPYPDTTPPSSNAWDPKVVSSVSSGQPGFWDAPASTSQTTQLPVWNPEQQQMFSNLAGLASTPQPVYSGPMSAAENPYESQYFDYISGVPSQLQAALAALQGSFGPAYDTSREATEQYWQNTLLPANQRIFNEQVLPQFREQFAGPQFWSENRADQTTQLFDKYNQGLSSQYGSLVYADELARREALEKAAGRTVTGAPAIPGMVSQGADTIGKGGELARSIAQEKIAGDLQKWLMGGADPSGRVNAIGNPSVGLAQSLLGLNPYTYQNQSINTGPGLGYAIAMGAANGAGEAVSQPIMDVAGNLISWGANTIGSGLSSLGSWIWDNWPQND